VSADVGFEGGEGFCLIQLRSPKANAAGKAPTGKSDSCAQNANAMLSPGSRGNIAGRLPQSAAPLLERVS